MAGRSINKIFLLGNLGRDAETKFTPSGVARTTFSVATTRRIKDSQTGEWKDETDWHNVVLWRAENLASYLTKGKQVHIEGRLQTRSYEDKDGNKRYTTEVVVEEIILLGSRGEQSSESGGMVSMPRAAVPPRPAAAPAPAVSQEAQLPEVISDDDVPF
ncbi:MAG: single-stranded DNA-binding protein [Acidobacteria bacterium]|nr:single-stranded DNA-binding protein [Acidobacteriota bacterium]